MLYEWDEAKRQANISKHGVDFVEAMAVLEDMPTLLVDDRFDYRESRCIAIGEAKGRILVVAFTMRGDVFRIISVRKANARERRKYAD
ncbi:BrnT family toxin [Desulfolutivibrio sulfoxidireducens]|uniref:BrnT family toxin n=1 Tax=Desulfolutivibrio sulfoxidireducens TaxID=2773299 RepID=UPI00159DD781|nr:BrnT family toxin [Desulfolutivibrio sulfoxidireducens]